MAYSEVLADQVRAILTPSPDVVERKMFGGLAFMVAGNMCCGVMGEELIVRLPAEEQERALAEPHTGHFDFTGKPMKGFVVVRAEGLADDEALTGWVEAALAFASSLPPK